MKKIKTIIALLSLSALLGSCAWIDQFIGGGNHETTSQETSSGDSSGSSTPSTTVTAIELSQHEVSLGGGDSVQLTVSFTPSTAVNKQVIWSSNNTNVATVSSTGAVIGVGIGAVIHNWIPESWVEAVLGSRNPLGVVLATLVGVPMYADIFGTIPVAEALLTNQVSCNQAWYHGKTQGRGAASVGAGNERDSHLSGRDGAGRTNLRIMNGTLIPILTI